MKILGIIPARGGSKGIPEKNIKELHGKPLIAWTVEECLKSKLDRVIVTTDDEKIAKAAKEYGAEVPFIRPKELATDTMGIEPVLLHTVEWLQKNENYKADAIALTMPTSPIRPFKHINNAIDIFIKENPDSLVSVNEVIANENPEWMLKINDSGNVVLYNNEQLKKIKTRRQELPTCYSRNDFIYILKLNNLKKSKPNLYGKNVKLYVMDNFYNIDINTPLDWFICEQKMKWVLENDITLP